MLGYRRFQVFRSFMQGTQDNNRQFFITQQTFSPKPARESPATGVSKEATVPTLCPIGNSPPPKTQGLALITLTWTDAHFPPGKMVFSPLGHFLPPSSNHHYLPEGMDGVFCGDVYRSAPNSEPGTQLASRDNITDMLILTSCHVTKCGPGRWKQNSECEFSCALSYGNH